MGDPLSEERFDSLVEEQWDLIRRVTNLLHMFKGWDMELYRSEHPGAEFESHMNFLRNSLSNLLNRFLGEERPRRIQNFDSYMADKKEYRRSDDLQGIFKLNERELDQLSGLIGEIEMRVPSEYSGSDWMDRFEGRDRESLDKTLKEMTSAIDNPPPSDIFMDGAGLDVSIENMNRLLKMSDVLDGMGRFAEADALTLRVVRAMRRLI